MKIIMQDQIFIVKYITVKDCFLHLSNKWLKRISASDGCLRVNYGEKYIYMTWSPQSLAVDEDTVGLSGPFCRSLGINDGDMLLCTLHPPGNSLKCVHASSLNQEDWDILEMNSLKIQTSLLDQVRVVSVDQIIVVWTSKSLYFSLKIVALEPNLPYGQLEQYTELIVAPPEINNTKVLATPSETLAEKDWSWSDAFKSLLPTRSKCTDVLAKEHKDVSNTYNTFTKYQQEDLLICRVHPLLAQVFTSNNFFSKHIFNAFIRKEHVQASHNDQSVYKIVNVISSQVKNKRNTETDGENVPELEHDFVYLKLHVLEDVIDSFSTSEQDLIKENLPWGFHCSLGINEELCQVIKASIGDRVILERLKTNYNLSCIELCTLQGERNIVDMLDWFKHFVIENSTKTNILIVNNMAINAPYDSKYVKLKIKLKPEKVAFAEINADTLRSCRVIVNNESQKYNRSDFNMNTTVFNKKHIYTKVKLLQHIVDGSVKCLQMGMRFSSITVKPVENVLILGSEGTGKSVLANQIAQTLSQPPYLCYVKVVECCLLKGVKMETIHKRLKAALTECALHEPSLLVLDDLETLGAAPKEDNIPDTIVTNRLTDVLASLLEEYQRTHYISILATASSMNKINSRLCSARGKHLFNSVHSIPELEKVDRVNIVRFIISNLTAATFNLDRDVIGNKTEGYVMQDLVDLSEKAVFHAWKQKDNLSLSRLTVDSDCMHLALEHNSPLRFGSAGLQGGHKDDTWDAIGGLQEVKDTLIEVLQWPAMYSEIFSHSPLRHQSGVLLFGPPGCGKTILAGAVAAHCGLRMISIKGPELLSKYIGASEEAVRNVFIRAQSAKPCILFFDEFDSLAPRRGHDSTGVTDRVVNQLLTQLDGVEGLVGVSVLAATSRPDLIDPALLRPGRLDRVLHCPMPNQSERLSILQCLSDGLTLADNGVLQEVAEGSDGLSGADLQAVLHGAHVQCMEQRQESDDLEGPLVVTSKQLFDSLHSTRPSLTEQERRKYDRIYNKFLRSRGARQSATDIRETLYATSSRATLA